MNIVLLGCPGAGKGTQSKNLCGKYRLTHIATGDLLRAQIEAKTALGLKVADYLRRGTLVPDEVVVEMVAHQLDASPGGWLLDGFPRTLTQAIELDKYLKANASAIDLILYLEMRPAEVVSRLTSRRTCASCGEVYNLISRPPRSSERCDRCAGTLARREDDAEATVLKRLMVYEDLTRPLIAYYRGEHELHTVDGSRSPEEVAAALAAVLDASSAARSARHA